MEISSFQKAVYAAAGKIPRGRVTSYQAIAKHVGRPLAYRAVGNALNKNPFAPKVPCHRVVKANGEIGGFFKGERKKRNLLANEGVLVSKGKIKDFKKIFIFYKF